MRKIVMTAYDVNPFKGSESGTGWNFPFHLAKYNHVTLITRENNQEYIDVFLEETNSTNVENMEFLYFDLPYWSRFWKRGHHGARLYFWLWQLGVVLFLKKNKITADIYHGLNFHTDNTPSFLWLLGRTTVWGPINHNEPIPAGFLNTKEWIKDRIKWVARRIIWSTDPFIYLAKRKTSLVLAANLSVVKRLKLENQKNYKILMQIASRKMETNLVKKRENSSFNFLSVGRFIPIKSMSFTLEAFEIFFKSLTVKEQNKVYFTVVGTGPLEQNLHNQVIDYSARDRIIFRPWMPQSELFDLYHKADCFVNFSHEGAGVVNAEALANGLPIICFDTFGAGNVVTEACGIKVPISLDYGMTIQNAVQALRDVISDQEYAEKLSKNALSHFSKNLNWESQASLINNFYDILSHK